MSIHDTEYTNPDDIEFEELSERDAVQMVLDQVRADAVKESKEREDIPALPTQHGDTRITHAEINEQGRTGRSYQDHSDPEVFKATKRKHNPPKTQAEADLLASADEWVKEWNQ